MELFSTRLALRPWADADAPALFELARDPRVGTAAGWPPHTSEEQSLDILRNVLQGPEQYAITLRESGELIGAIGLLTGDACDYLEADDEYSVGYWIGVPYWGQGFAAEALQRLIDHARDSLGTRAIYADHFLENTQSHRVMEKCGLLPVRTQTTDVLYPAGKRDVLIMRRLLVPHIERNDMKNSSETTLQSSLRSANFILLVLGQGISLFGNTMLRFAMSMWVLDETGSATIFATVLAISVIPTILISPFGGIMADRISKRAMMVALDIISGIVTLLATVFFALSGFNILAIAIMQVVLAVLDAMETPVVQSALPQIIGRESSTDLRRGTAIINQVQQLSQLLPSFLGGVMYGLVGIRPMMLITAACLMSAAMVECFIRLAKPLSNQDDTGICLLGVIIGDMHSATAFLLRKEPTVARLAGVCTWINLILTGFSSVSFPYIIRTTLGYDAATYGLCDGIIGIAGIAGTFIAGCFANRLKSQNAPSLLFVESLMLLPPAIAFLLPCSTQTKLIMLVFCTAVVIISVDFLNLILVPSIQMRTPTAFTGKVMAIISSLTICAQPLGQMLYGWLHAHCTVWLILLISALASLPLAWLAHPLFTHLDDTISK